MPSHPLRTPLAATLCAAFTLLAASAEESAALRVAVTSPGGTTAAALEVLMAKDGADGVYAAAFPDGRAVAVKIADGGDRARPPVMVAALARLGVDTTQVAPLVQQSILGHGHPVGAVRAVF
mgnify:CR=1 FL=1